MYVCEVPVKIYRLADCHLFRYKTRTLVLFHYKTRVVMKQFDLECCGCKLRKFKYLGIPTIK